MKRNVARLILISAGFIWGIGFVVNKTILDAGWTESELLFVRFFTATIAIFIIYFKRIIRTDKATILWGLFLGIFLYLGFFFQTWGLANTTPSNNALLTAAYIILMPVIVWIFERKTIHRKTILAGFITLLGISFITVDFEELSIDANMGDMLTLIGALFYSIHIYFLGKKTKQVDLFVLMSFQLLMFSIIAFVVMITRDGTPPIDFSSMESTKYLILAVVIGFFASFLAFLFQSIGQKYTNEAEAAILISTESLFGPILAIVFYGDPFGIYIAIGIILVFGGIVLSELDIKYTKKSKKIENS
jgi:drug/metabolite transporter (DMT)-like permease